MSEAERLLQEQIDYYNRRAEEFDVTSATRDDSTLAFRDALPRALAGATVGGAVLELACGTGNWTKLLATRTDDLTAVDAAPEMLDRARAKVGTEKVRFVEADIFNWRPTRSYDFVFFAFWLSHVPMSRFEEFWALVDAATESDGRVFFIDERGHDSWHEDFIGSDVVRRTLLDGTTHRVVKRFWEVEELTTALAGLGWTATITGVGPFYWGEAKI